jgi:hypothetical protein
MHERYKDNGNPAELPCRMKCLLLFQIIDGQVYSLLLHRKKRREINLCLLVGCSFLRNVCL